MAYSFWSQRYRKYEQLTLPGLALVVAVALTVIVLIPQMNSLWQDQQEIRELNKKLAALKEKAALLQTLDAAELANRSDKLRQSVPNNEDLGYFILGAKDATNKSGMKFRGVEMMAQSEKPAEAAGTPEIAKRKTVVMVKKNQTTLEISLQGNLAPLVEFLRLAEESLPLNKIVKFNFSRQQTQEMIGKVTVDYFYLPLPETIGAPEAQLPVITQAEEQVYSQIAEFTAPEVVELPEVPVGNTNLIL